MRIVFEIKIGVNKAESVLAKDSKQFLSRLEPGEHQHSRAERLIKASAAEIELN